MPLKKRLRLAYHVFRGHPLVYGVVVKGSIVAPRGTRVEDCQFRGGYVRAALEVDGCR